VEFQYQERRSTFCLTLLTFGFDRISEPHHDRLPDRTAQGRTQIQKKNRKPALVVNDSNLKPVMVNNPWSYLAWHESSERFLAPSLFRSRSTWISFPSLTLHPHRI
jgi:hypothetical protein